MRSFRLRIAYDGTGYVGWQRQSEGLSIQGLIEDAAAPLQGSPPAIVGAGRTDAGVHASGQVASVRLATRLMADDLRRALNARLPPDVRVLSAAIVHESFHARFDARAKTYEYRIYNGPLMPPFTRRFAWHVPVPLDREAMSEAARLVAGTHDFAGFQSTGSDVHTTVRHVEESTVVLAAPAGPGPVPDVDAGGLLLIYRITGSGFLRHMVRAIAGTLVEVGRGAAPPSLVADLLAGRGRAAAGPTAPACGLCLTEVRYGEGVAPVAAHR